VIMKIMDWNEQITPRKGLTLHQWMVSEAIRAKQWADYYWYSLDEDHELPETNELIRNYELVCDWIDEIANFPEGAYHSAP